MLVLLSISGLFLCALLLGFAHWRIHAVSSHRIQWDATKLTDANTVLVLGCPRLRPDGRVNKYYQYRLDAALRLYQAHKISRLILSDNHPEWMKQDLEAMGVPSSLMELDPKGLTTIDSVRQLQHRYPAATSSWVVVSQPDHLARTLYLTDHFGLPARGYAAGDVQGVYSIKNKVRESLARVKALIHLHLGRAQLEPQAAADL